MPEAGETESQGTFDAAVHDTLPAPACVSRTAWPSVCELNDAPEVTAPKYSDDRSTAMVGPVPACVTVKVCPAIVSEPVR